MDILFHKSLNAPYLDLPSPISELFKNSLYPTRFAGYFVLKEKFSEKFAEATAFITAKSGLDESKLKESDNPLAEIVRDVAGKDGVFRDERKAEAALCEKLYALVDEVLTKLAVYGDDEKGVMGFKSFLSLVGLKG